jgi:hypothetical protein
MDRLPDCSNNRKRDSRSAASSSSPLPPHPGAYATPGSDEPANKRTRREEVSLGAIAGHHNGHTYSHGIANDSAEVQYGDRHKHVYNYNACHAHPRDGPHARLEEEQDEPDDVVQALESMAFAQMEERRDTISRSYSNTCEWLFQKPEYLSWRDSAKMSEHYGFFWIKSKPGAGKSTLMKFFFRSAKERLPENHVIYFFFNARGESLEKSLEGLYRSLLHQLFTNVPRVQDLLRAARDIKKWPLESLKSLFAEAVMGLVRERLTCLIDALDECPEVEIRELVEFFEELGEAAVDKGIELRVCFSSRHYPHVTMDKCQHMVLDGQEGHEQDITKYVKNKLKARKGKTGEEIRQAVQAKAQGVFMWVVLVVRILNKESDRGSNNAALKRCLDQIPSELHKLFEDILHRGIQDDHNLIPLLQWVSFAQRPLTCEELYSAVRSGQSDFDVAKPWDPDNDDPETMTLFILNSSKGLAELTRGRNPTIQFIHESVRDYLRETGFRVLAPDLHSSLLSSTHEYLKRCCCRCIADDVIEQLDLPDQLPKAKSQEAKELRKNAATRFPFLAYSANHLVQHAELVNDHGIPQVSFIKTFPWRQWITVNNILAIYDTRRIESSSGTAMCILAGNNATGLLALELAQEQYPTIVQYEQALQTAITAGSHRSLAMILDVLTTAQLDHTHTFGNQLIKLAIAKVDVDALRIISQYIALRQALVGTHLESALRTKNEDILQVMMQWLSRDFDPSSLEVPLINACTNGHADIARLLLARGADASFVDRNGNTLLHMAIICDRAQVVGILLSHGVRVNTQNRTYKTPLAIACTRGQVATVRLLLDNGAEVGNGQNGTYETPLAVACSRDQIATTPLLPDRGAGVRKAHAEDYSPIFQACLRNDLTIVNMLLEGYLRSPVPDIWKQEFTTALRFSMEHGLPEIVSMFRMRGFMLPEDTSCPNTATIEELQTDTLLSQSPGISQYSFDAGNMP